MSLLEDVLQLLRYVLEYFGVPQEVLVPVWESSSCGQYRSIVRMIGTNLPLAPYPRLHFQIPLQVVQRHGHIEVSVETPAIPSLADVLWLDEDEADGCTKFRSSVPVWKKGWPQRLEGSEVVPVRTAPVPGPNAQPEALQKIHALEEELLKLRAQIAQIISAPTAQSPLLTGPITCCFSPLPPPSLTSTPLIAPPPPPPPLPPPAVAGPVQVSMSEVIRQRQAERRDCVRSVTGASDSSASSLPSMLEVLKDLNQVKLRSIERSPGGTPMRKRRSKGVVSVSDPAALIAEALKRKFAHRQENSFDKENRSAEPSPFSSPDTPRIPHLMRRSQSRNHL